MKKIAILVIAITFSNSSSAANWVQITSGNGLQTRADLDSLVQLKNGDRKAWIEYLYEEDQTANNGVKFARAMNLTTFRCSERTLANSQQLLYSGGNVVGTLVIPERNREFKDVPPDTFDEASFNFVCKRNIAKK